MTMLQVLSKVVGSEKLLGQIALAKFVLVIDMFCTNIPLRGVRKLFSTKSADIGPVLSRRSVKCRLHA